MIKKVLIVLTLLFCLTGCESNSKDSEDDYTILFYTDSETCVEYIKYASIDKGGITPRFNADGSLKLNKECLERDS